MMLRELKRDAAGIELWCYENWETT